MAGNKAQDQIAEQDLQKIRQLEEQIKRLRAELDEFIKAEQVMVAAGLISEAKVKQAHEIVQSFG